MGCGIVRKVRKHGRVNLIAKTVVVAGALLIGVKFISLSAEVADARKAYSELKSEHASAQQDTAELQDAVDNGITDRYIIKVAHKYGYALPNETLYLDIYSE